MSFKLRVMDTTTSSITIKLMTLSSSPITATCSGGVVTVDALVEQIASPYLGTGRVVISGLSPSTGYIYSVTQDGVTVTNDEPIRTMPADQATDYSFVVGTCSSNRSYSPVNAFKHMKALVQSSTIPVLFYAHIDDVNYSDTAVIADTVFSGHASTGQPQTTKLKSDFCLSWAAHFGLFQTESKWREANTQWIYQNLPLICSGGDHMIANNHCRGRSVNGFKDSDYQGCERTVAAGVGVNSGPLEANAVAAWNDCLGDGNPPMLRAGKLHWGKEVGPLRMALADSQLYGLPYDTVLSPDPVHFGAEQLGDLMTYLDVDTVPFKLMFLETGFSLTGQPWLEWHGTEANAWKADMESRANLNGATGNFFGVYGDNHSMHALEFDSFWAFSAGTTGDAQSVTPGLSRLVWGWLGKFHWGRSSVAATGDQGYGGFWQFIVYASRSPKEIEARYIDGGTGNVIAKFYTYAGAPNNAWYLRPSAGLGIG